MGQIIIVEQHDWYKADCINQNGKSKLRVAGVMRRVSLREIVSKANIPQVEVDSVHKGVGGWFGMKRNGYGPAILVPTNNFDTGEMLFTMYYPKAACGGSHTNNASRTLRELLISMNCKVYEFTDSIEMLDWVKETV